jgi:hypothetical protein
MSLVPQPTTTKKRITDSCSLMHSINRAATSLYGTVHTVLSLLKTQQKWETTQGKSHILYNCQLFHSCQHHFWGTLILPSYFLLYFVHNRWHKNKKCPIFNTSCAHHTVLHYSLLKKCLVNSYMACSKMFGIYTVKFEQYKNTSI